MTPECNIPRGRTYYLKYRFYSNIGTLKYINKNIDDISVEIFIEIQVEKEF